MALLNQSAQSYYDGENYGNYQFVSLNDIIEQFMLIYVGEDKIIPRAKRLDVSFHAQRAMAELSFDTFKSFKSIEFEIPATLQQPLPQDYVNYTKIMWVDSAGIKHPIYPTKHTQNPVSAPLQDTDYNFKLEAEGSIVISTNTITLTNRTENVFVGMAVSGLDIPNGAIIRSVTHNTSDTVIVLEDIAGNDVDATATATVILQFTNQDGSLIKQTNSINVVSDLDWTDGDNFITANSTGDISSLEVGMLVYHEDFPVGTKIANITTTTILLDQDATDTMAANAGQVVFVDPNKNTTTWSNYKSHRPHENSNHDFDYDDELYDVNIGGRYGLDPTQAQTNGSFYIDDARGLVHFSSNISGNTAVIDYISDGLGTEDEMKVHKFAEEAMYKCLLYSIASGRVTTPEYMVQRLRKDKFAAVRTAKLRLSNLKIEELTQILRGKSKIIKH